jgi:hypothetical protein
VLAHGLDRDALAALRAAGAAVRRVEAPDAPMREPLRP